MQKKIDVAILGMGGMGATHIEAAKESEYTNKIYGFEPDSTRRLELSKKNGITPATFEEILANPEIKFLSIASPNNYHVEQAIAGLHASKAVLCEKPLGLTLQEAKQVIDVQKETKGFLQVGFELHYSKMYETAKKWIDSGKIGQVVNVQTRYYCCEFHKKNTWRSQAPGSFLIGEKLSHYLDFTRWVMGSDVASVYSANSPNVVDYFNHHDNHQMIMKFKNGGVGVLNFIMYVAENFHGDPLQDMVSQQADDGHCLSAMICGTKGAIEVDVFKRRIRRWEFSDDKESLQSKITETISFEQQDDLLYFHNVHGQNLRVIELVSKGLSPEVSALDAYETMKLCFAAEESENTGKIIYL